MENQLMITIEFTFSKETGQKCVMHQRVVTREIMTGKYEVINEIF